MSYMATHASIIALLYSEGTSRMVFKIGVAHSHGTLPEDLFRDWIHFLVEDLALVDYGDTLLKKDYERINILLRELRKWVDGPGGPSLEMVRDAEKAAPVKSWEPPTMHYAWKYEVRAGGPLKYKRKDYSEWNKYDEKYDDYWVFDVSDE